MYRSHFTSDALNDVKALPKHIRNALKKEFERNIHRDPIGCSEPLSHALAGFRSFHFQSYRVVYRVYEDLHVVAVVGIGRKDASHHAEIYARLEKIAESGKLADSVLKTLRLHSRH